MKVLYILIISCCLFTSCIAVKYHDYAEINKEVAKDQIQQLKTDTLLIVVPSFKKKTQILKNTSRRNRKARKKNKQKLLVLYAERQIQQNALIQSFMDNYTFSSILFIPDSLVHNFESGIEGNYFINESLKIDTSIHYSNTKPIKLVQQFDQEWQVKIGNKMLPNPFPNYYIYRNGLYGFLGNETYQMMYERVATTFQKRFDQFYSNPDRKVYL